MGQLYVSVQTGNAILRFTGATQANGNISPAATINSNSLAGPQYIFVDTAGNRLYVANSNNGNGNILVFEKVSTLSGTVTPDRTISATPSTPLTAPFDVAVDTTANDLLYVADTASQAIVVFTNASTANGPTLVSRILNLGFTPSAILLDAGNDRLFVADSNNAVNIFNGASKLPNGSVTANFKLSGPDTQLNQPAGLRFDGAGQLIVSNAGSGGSITIYNNGATVNGDQKPVAIILGSNTTFSSPAQIALDPTTNQGEVYIADPNANAGEIAVFSSITTASGTTTPGTSRSISGNNTMLSGARGVALDTTR